MQDVFDAIIKKRSTDYCYDTFIYNNNKMIYDDNIIYINYEVNDSKLTIFNVDVDEKYKSQGKFSKLLLKLENHFSCIEFDTVINERLKLFLIKRGYTPSKTTLMFDKNLINNLQKFF